MYNLHKLLANLTLTDWSILLSYVIAWIGAVYLLGSLTERKWGDRESGALVGFLYPDC
jgi:hypothetical protein